MKSTTKKIISTLLVTVMIFYVVVLNVNATNHDTSEKWVCVSTIKTNGDTILRQYNDNGDILFDKRIDKNGNVYSCDEYKYDNNGNCILINSLKYDGKYIVYSYENNLKTKYESYLNYTLQSSLSYEYSSSGQLIKVVSNFTNKTIYSYDYLSSGELIMETFYVDGKEFRYTTYSYTNGYLSGKKVFDSNGNQISKYSYDKFGNETYYYCYDDQTKRITSYNEIGNMQESRYYQFGDLKEKTTYTFRSNGYWYKSVTEEYYRGKQTTETYYDYDSYWNLVETRTYSNNTTLYTYYKYEKLSSEGIVHYYDNDCDTECNVCGLKRTTSHNFGEWEVTIPATVSAEGLEKRFCTACNFFETRTIPKIKGSLGDVNLDEKINSFDALLVLQHSVGLIVLTDDACLLADVTKDNLVNSNDALKMLKLSVGKIESF